MSRRVLLVSIGAAGVGAMIVLAPSGSASQEGSVQVRGVLEVAHADDPVRGTATHDYALRGDDGRRTALRFGDDGPHGLGGQQVEVRGQRRGDVVEVARADDAQATGESGGTATAAASTDVRYAVVLIDFSDLASAVSPEQVTPLVFGGEPASTVESFYADTSYGQQPVPGGASSVFGPVTIAASKASSCDYRAWGAQARTAAAEVGYVDADYTHVAFVMPKTTCSFLGIAELPGKYTWNVTGAITPGDQAQERAFRGLLEHELGHNLAAYHGASLACTDNRGRPVVLGSRCTRSEYGDPFTVMGDHRGERSFNAFQRGRVSGYATTQDRLPWLPAGETVTAPTGASTTTLEPLDAVGTTGTAAAQVLRVPRPGSRTGEFYYVELRGGSGFDDARGGRTPVTGVTIRLAPDYATGIATQLLDMTPGTSAGFLDAALAPGASFTDGAGVTIRNATPATTSGSATIEVTIAAASRGKPS